MRLIVSQSIAQPLTLGIDRSTGNLVATDVWNSREYNEMVKDSGRKVDEHSGELINEVGPWHIRMWFILANEIELATNGTSLKASTIIGYYALPGYSNPNDFISHFWIETSDDTGSLGNVYYGNYSGFPNHFEDSIPISGIKVEALSHEKTKAGEVLWILKVNYSIELQRSVDFIPKIDINFAIGANMGGYYINSTKNKMATSNLKLQLQRSIISDTNVAKLNKNNTSAVSTARPPNAATTIAIPEIRLSITKQDGFLLITFSPAVTNANLEQANVNSYPWAWQPAITVTNNSATNGWYVDPTLEARVFRVRIDR